MTPGTTDSRFEERVDRSGECWIWMGARMVNGYGRLQVDGRQVLAHRYAYERVRGAIPAELVLDHLCRNRACVRPEHLEPVTNAENIRRGESPAGLQSRQTACKHGHPLSGDNLVVYGDGHRRCRACELIRSRRRYDPAFSLTG